jgi:hypothetical protein
LVQGCSSIGFGSTPKRKKLGLRHCRRFSHQCIHNT